MISNLIRVGLYNERIGNLVCVAKDASVIEALKSQMSLIVRTQYSTPPNHGAQVAAMILNSPEMRAKWEQSVLAMSARIRAMRSALFDQLVALDTPGDWTHVTCQIGQWLPFAYIH